MGMHASTCICSASSRASTPPMLRPQTVTVLQVFFIARTAVLAACSQLCQLSFAISSSVEAWPGRQMERTV